MIGNMLILSGVLTVFLLLGVAGKWRVEHDAKQKQARSTPAQNAH